MDDQLNYVRPDDATTLRELVEEKCNLLSEVPGVEVEFSPDEADMAGAFQEDALTKIPTARATALPSRCTQPYLESHRFRSVAFLCFWRKII